MKPTLLKISQGTFSADQAHENEPEYDPLTNPVNLNTLDEEGRKEWDAIFPLLNERKLITEVDERLLLEWCRVISKLRFINGQITNDKLIVRHPYLKDNWAINPLVKLYEMFFNKMIILSARFGFSPADRTRINMPQPYKKNKEKNLIRRAI